MTPIPGEPLDPKPQELTMSDARKVKFKVAGLAPAVKPMRPRSAVALSLLVMIRG